MQRSIYMSACQQYPGGPKGWYWPYIHLHMRNKGLENLSSMSKIPKYGAELAWEPSIPTLSMSGVTGFPYIHVGER